jgi:hypothetical protein
MLVVQVGGGPKGDEKLTAVRAWPRICHGKNSPRIMQQFRVEFVFKFAPKRAFAATTCARWIPALNLQE